MAEERPPDGAAPPSHAASLRRWSVYFASGCLFWFVILPVLKVAVWTALASAGTAAALTFIASQDFISRFLEGLTLGTLLVTLAILQSSEAHRREQSRNPVLRRPWWSLVSFAAALMLVGGLVPSPRLVVIGGMTAALCALVLLTALVVRLARSAVTASARQAASSTNFAVGFGAAALVASYVGFGVTESVAATAESARVPLRQALIAAIHEDAPPSRVVAGPAASPVVPAAHSVAGGFAQAGVEQDSDIARCLEANVDVLEAGRRRAEQLVGPFEAEDLAHAVYLALCGRKGVREFRPYFFASLENLARKWGKRRARDCPIEDAPEPHCLPDTRFVDAQEWQVVRGAMCRLEPSDEALIEAHLFDGQTHADIARRTGRTPAAVRKQYQRALERLRAQIPPSCQ